VTRTGCTALAHVWVLELVFEGIALSHFIVMALQSAHSIPILEEVVKGPVPVAVGVGVMAHIET